MTVRRGQIVGIPFPYADLQTRKRRPVVMLTEPDRYGDFIAVAVTSVPTDFSPSPAPIWAAGPDEPTSLIRQSTLLGLAKRVKAKIFQASTSEVYGDPEVHPQPEHYWGRVNPIGEREDNRVNVVAFSHGLE